MSILNKYISSIATFIIFSAIVEILIANTNFKKYFKLVFGMILIILIIRPITDIFGGDFPGIDNVFRQNEFVLDKEIMNLEKNNYEEKQNELITTTYKVSMKENIRDYIYSRFSEITIHDIEIMIEEDNSQANYAELLEIRIYCAFEISDSQIKKIKRVEKVEIVKDRESEIVKEIQTENELGLKKSLKDFYNLDENNIHIIVSTN